MDHLPLPSTASAHLMVPCLCAGDYDNGPFSTFPARHNWEVNFHTLSIEKGVLSQGKIPSIRSTHAFMQTWLYFGTLYEIMGDSVNISEFIIEDADGNRFLSTVKLRQIMSEWFLRGMQSTDTKEKQQETLFATCTDVRSHLDTLYYVLGGVRGIADPGTLAATAILGESFENYVCTMHLDVLDIETPVYLNWSVISSEWLINHMESSGWCPSSITKFTLSGQRISALYYYCHLPPSSLIKDHSSCTSNTCLTLKIDPANYRVAHTIAPCDCPELTLDVGSIGETLGKHRIPLIEISSTEDLANTKIKVREDDGKTDFVAISHVWADGLGNPMHNSLPTCSLQELSQLVCKLPMKNSPNDEPVPFWIDTICVPIEPPNLKQAALNFLRRPYLHAEHVLVLDNYLRSVSSKDCDILEIFARVSCGNWISRLWTLQEGRLAKRVWIQFNDRAIDLKVLWDNYKRERAKGVDYWSMLTSIVTRWYASDVIGTDDLKADEVPFLREALCFRSVSVPADEALCLCCLAGLDMKIVASVPASATLRMKAFWNSIQKVPSGLLFSKCAQKLDEPGFRWAPLTFMGALPRFHWAGKVKDAENLDGVPTPRGLLVKSSGYICNISWKKLKDWGGIVFKGGTNWFTLCLEEPWHATIASIPQDEPLKMAIILEKSPLNEKPPWNRYLNAVIGYVGHEETHTTYVKCLQHVDLYRSRPTEELVFEAVLKYVSMAVLDKDMLLYPNEQAVRMTKAYIETYPHFLSTIDNWLLISRSGAGLENYAVRLVEMLTSMKMGGNVEEVSDNHCWIVD